MKDGCPVQKPIVTQKANIEAELLDLLQDFALKLMHQSQLTVDLWKQVCVYKYPAFRQTSQRLLSIFGTTYCCESMYSAMKNVKPKNRAVHTNQDLRVFMKTATTCSEPDIKKIETYRSTWM